MQPNRDRVLRKPTATRRTTFYGQRLEHSLRAIVLSFCTGLLACSLLAAESPYEEAIAAARELIDQRLDTLPGFSAAVAMDGEIVWAEGFGLADVASKTPVTTETRFRIGSTSKPLTTALVGRLLEKGAIELDQDIRQLFPDFPEKEHVITLRHLITNQSGIRHYKGAEFINRKHYEELVDGVDIFAADPLRFEPGTQFLYSSHAFNLAGVILELAGGADFPTLLEREVFSPLGMMSSCTDDVTKEIPARATFYNRAKDGPRPAIDVDDSYKWPSGGLLSTPTDLVRFGSAFLSPRTTAKDTEPWLTRETIDLLLTPQDLANGEVTGYAMGWRVQAANPQADPPTSYYVHHGGSSMGGRSMLLLMPDEGIVVSILTNSDDYKSKEKDASSIARFFRDARKRD